MKSSLPGLPVDAREELIKKLIQLETLKEKEISRIVLFWVLIIGVSFGLILAFSSFESSDRYILLYVVIAQLLLGFLDSRWRLKRLRRTFKEKAIVNILKYLLPTIQYDYYQKLNASNVRGTRLFKKKAYRTKGEDFFKGKRGETEFKFSELTAKFKNIVPSRDALSHGKLTLNSFDGILIMCKIDVPITKSIRIHTKGAVGAAIHENMIPILTENDMFNIFGFPNQDYTYVTHSRFLGRLKDVRNTFKGNIYISLFPKSAHIAIETNSNFFDPKLRKKIDMKQVERIYQEIVNCLMVVDVIDELNQSETVNRDYTKLEL